MNKKRTLIYGIVLAVLALLVYLQFRTWSNFDWPTFWSQTNSVSLRHIAQAIGLIYLAYLMRAIRWKIFLRPVRDRVSVWALVSPTVVGFTGLALLGRAGELIRPYLIARKEKLTFSSQLAVWAIERIFDVGAFTILLVLAIFFSPNLRQLSYYGSFRKGGFFLVAVVAGLTLVASFVHWKGDAFADWVARRFAHLATDLGGRIALRIREFRGGLNTIQGGFSLLQLIGVSILMWYLIAIAYREVTHSYALDVLNIPVSEVYLLMGSSMLGSMIQLPGVGGGSQLATIATLEHVFQVPHELAASCGILIWLVTFVSVIPVGLLLAHRERLSLRELSKDSHHAEDAPTLASPPAAD